MMNKIHICLIMLSAVLLNSCAQRSSTAVPDKGSDSIYTRDYIYQISKSNPQRALALADTAEMRNLLRTDHTSLDILKSVIYYNGFRQPKLARHYAQKAYEDSGLQNDSVAYMTNLINLVSFSQDLGDYEGTIRYATQAIDIIRTHKKFVGEEGKLVMHIAMSQHALGLDKEAKANMKRAIAICRDVVDKNPCWNNVQNLFYTMGETMNQLGEMGDWQEAEALIPDLLKTNSLHEQLESEAPAGVIDMYRLYTYSQCMEIYQHLGNKELADEYYQKCLTTEFVKSPEGLGYLIRYQLWTENYQLALHNIQIVKQAFQKDQKTDSETYVNKLLVDEVEALTRLGRYKDAADVSREIMALKETLFERKLQDDAQELAVIFQSGEKDKQIQKEQDEKRLLVVIIIAIIAALGVVLYYNRKIHRRNISLVRSVQESIACKDELLQKEEECRSHKAIIETLKKKLAESEDNGENRFGLSSGAEEASELTENDLTDDEHEPLKHLLHEIAVRRLYLQPGITSKTMQEELHVPASLFGDSFKERTGHSFSEYINKLRMDYAAKLLTQYPQYTVDAIGKMCGIDSRQHFHRLFSEYFGITPSVFRKSHTAPDNKDITK